VRTALILTAISVSVTHSVFNTAATYKVQ